MQRAALQRAETTRRNGNLACNRQHGTMRKRQDLIPDATDSKIGCNGQHCNMQSRQHATLQHVALFYNMQRCSNLQHATRTTDRMQQTSCTTDSIATDTMQLATRKGIATCTADIMQHCNMQRAALQRTAVVPWYRACVLQHATARAILTPF